MTVRLIEGKIVGGPHYMPTYELTVEHSSLFGLIKRVQKYRGNYAWKLYPQGYSADAVFLQPWLEAQKQQFEWSQEHRPMSGVQ